MTINYRELGRQAAKEWVAGIGVKKEDGVPFNKKASEASAHKPTEQAVRKGSEKP
jgi:hypothetical protein